MKKIILLILITFIASFAFNFNVTAINKDASATCIYNFPNDGEFPQDGTIFTGVKLIYKDRKLLTESKECLTANDRIIAGIDRKCEVNVSQISFENETANVVYCPTLKYYFKQEFLAYRFKLVDDIGYYKLANDQLKNAVVKTLLPSPSSTINQGTIPTSENEESDYLECLCGDVLLRKGEIIFKDTLFKAYNDYKKDYKNGFNINNIKECPAAIYYSIVPPKGSGVPTLEISDTMFASAKKNNKVNTLSCDSTVAIEAYINSGSKKNPTDYKPQEDVIADFCTETSRAWRVFGYLITALKILIPVIIIVMGSLDLGKAVVANSEDEMKKATQVLIKRIIAGIVIFFIPTIINLVLKLASNYVGVVSSGSGCIECVSKPGSC